MFTIAPGSAAWAIDAPLGDVTSEQENPGTDGTSETPVENEVAIEDAPEVEALAAPSEDESLTPFAVGDGTLSLTISQQTGTEPFQDNNDPGNDSGMDNDIIRTNDTITYNLGIRYEGEDHTTPTVKFSIPQGQELVNLPPFCLAGSSVTPAALPAPAVPLTADSWESFPRQELVCVLKDEAIGTSLNYSFLTKVRGEVPHGTVMDESVFRVTSDQVVDPETTEPVTQTVSAKPRFDLSKQFRATGPGAAPCPWDRNRQCQIMPYPITIDAGQGAKGSTPLQSPIVFEDDLTPASFYGAEVWAKMVAEAGSESAAKTAYAPRVTDCGAPVSGGHTRDLPTSKLNSGNTPANSVRDSGTFTCDGSIGDPVKVTITNADTSGITVPTTTGSGAALPANSGLVVSALLTVQFPADAVVKFGNEPTPGNFRLPVHNVYENVEMTGIDGSKVVDDPANNTSDYTVMQNISTGDLSKFFSGIYGQAGNTVPWAPGIEGPPGAAVIRDGQTQVMSGQAVQSVLSSQGRVPGGLGPSAPWSSVLCDVWDADRLTLAGKSDWTGGPPGRFPSNGKPAWTIAQTNTENVKFEYSIGDAGPGSKSDCTGGTWVNDPSDLVTPHVDASGRTMWPGVNRVRVAYTSNIPGGSTDTASLLQVAIGLVVNKSEDGSPIPNWASQVKSNGTRTGAEVIADPNRTLQLSSYDPEKHQGAPGDRLIPGDAIVRVNKEVQNPTSGEYSSTTAPQYTSGANVNYRLQPSLTAPVITEGAAEEVILEDCLPRYQVFSASTQGGTAIAPELAQFGAPADSEMICASNRQYVRWNLGLLAVGKPIEPIVVTAEILEVARNGVYTNNTLVSSPNDHSPVSVRSDDVQMQLVVPTGIKISKTVDKPVIEVNPDAVTNPRTLTWSVFFANIDGPPNVANVDVIDRLPANGLFANDFTGALEFNSAAPVAGDKITVLYSKTASADLATDPKDPTNAADGATVWCDAATGGTVVIGDGTAADCPAANAEITGLRFQRPGEFNPDDEFQVDIKMTPIGNVSGDKYRNQVAGQVDGVTQGAGPARRDVTVVASTVGDRVWKDINSNGLQDDGESGVEGVKVRLVGTDVDGNDVDLEATTDAAGSYLFEELASGTYRVIFDPSTIPSNSRFTSQHEGSDPGIDSDADTTTGEAQEFVLGIDTDELSLDAGLITADGALIINKMLEGAGVAPFGGDDELTFQVVCTLDDKEVLKQDVTLQANGGTSVTSEPIAPIPALSECTVTETGAGDADADSLPEPVTVTIPWDGASATAETVTASLTNYYSAGQIQLEKVLEGDSTRLGQVKDTEFEFLITCQIEEGNAEGERIRTDVVSGTWRIKGGEVIILGTDDVDPILIPLGARCFGEETEDGGATKSTISHDSYDDAVEVTEGTPAELQTLTIEAVNQFLCDEATCGTSCTENCPPGGGSTPPGVLSITGAAPGLLLWGALGLLLTGAVVLYSRRRQRSAAPPSE